MGYLDNTVEYGFGQLGSGFLDDTDTFLPPSGLVIVAITVVDACNRIKGVGIIWNGIYITNYIWFFILNR